MASIQKRPNGKWRARYRDPDGKERSRHFTRKVDAQRFLDEITASMVTGDYVDPKGAKQTVAVTARAWLASNPDWEPSTRARNTSIVENHILPRWGDVQLGSITFEAVQGWVGDLEGAGGTIRKILSVFSGIMDLAVASKRLKSNPARGVKRPRQAMSDRRYLTAAQVEAFAGSARGGKLVVYILAYCGLRFGELAALRVRNVDELRRRLLVEGSVTEVNGALEWGTPKDHQRRSVPYPSFLRDDIAAQMKGKSPDDLLFTSPKGGVLRLRNARRSWLDRAAKEAGVEGFTPHEFRHTAASLAVGAGASVLAVQRMLGHDKPSTTLDVYSDLFDTDLDGVATRLDEVRAQGLADFLRTTPKLVAT